MHFSKVNILQLFQSPLPNIAFTPPLFCLTRGSNYILLTPLHIIDPFEFTGYLILLDTSCPSVIWLLPLYQTNVRHFPPEHDQWGTAAVHKAAVIFLSCSEGRSCPVPNRNLSSFIKACAEIQHGICCSLPTCGGTSNSNMCRGILRWENKT